MINVGTLIEFKSGMQYEVIKVFSQNLVDLRAIKPPFELMPDYYPIYYSIELKDYKILVPQNEAPKVSKHEDSGNVCQHEPIESNHKIICNKCGELLHW
jgi:hypothetical protein